MKVRELIERLRAMPDQEAEVHFAYNYGDYWRTKAAPAVARVVEGTVRDNDRIDMPELLSDEDEEPGVGGQEVVVLR